MAAAAPREGQSPSSVAQDYLKAIWTAQEWVAEPVTTTVLAARLGLSPSTVSEQIKRLADGGLVHHAPYRPVELTGDGVREALKVVRRHRLMETYLVAELGFTWDEVHAEAEVLEHVVSDVLVDRIDAKLGHPGRDPHGDPIPTAEGLIERPAARLLTTLRTGESGVVTRVADTDTEVLRRCAAAGLRPGTTVTVDSADVDGAGTLAVLLSPVDEGGSPSLHLPMAAAAAIHVSATDWPMTTVPPIPRSGN